MNADLYVHGMGGNAAEAAHYRPLFPDCDVIGLDYHGFTPWDAGREIREAVRAMCETHESVSIIANSIGAYFSLHAGIDALLNRAYFISPVVDMEALILARMAQAHVTEAALQAKGTIPIAEGAPLSWEYLNWVRTHPITWRVPTAILYGSADSLIPIETVEAFAKRHDASLTVMEGGEHWFHTDEQMAFLDDWLLKERRN